MKEDTPQTTSPALEPIPAKGSSKVWMIATIVLAIALVGLAIYGYMKIKNLNNEITGQKTEIANLQNTKKTLQDTASSAATAAAKVISDSSSSRTIPELGVKYKVMPDNANATYEYSVIISDGSTYQSAKFSSTDLILANAKTVGSNDNRCLASDGPLGNITLYKAGQILFDKKVEDQIGPNVKKIGSNFYVKQTPQSTCSDDKAVQDLQTSSIKQLNAIFDSLQAS